MTRLVPSPCRGIATINGFLSAAGSFPGIDTTMSLSDSSVRPSGRSASTRRTWSPSDSFRSGRATQSPRRSAVVPTRTFSPSLIRTCAPAGALPAITVFPSGSTLTTSTRTGDAVGMFGAGFPSAGSDGTVGDLVASGSGAAAVCDGATPGSAFGCGPTAAARVRSPVSAAEAGSSDAATSVPSLDSSAARMGASATDPSSDRSKEPFSQSETAITIKPATPMRRTRAMHATFRRLPAESSRSVREGTCHYAPH